ncbi:hypothetical protein ACROYT_G023663 [Oculina patagonica]
MADLKEDEYDLCHSNDNSTDSSQSSLQTVLVTFRIDKPSAKHIKRVRFNSLVEVKFIPRRKKEKKRKSRLEDEDKEDKSCADNATEKTNHKDNPTDSNGKETDIKGEVSVCEQWVAKATDKVPVTGQEGSCPDKDPQKFEAEVENVLDKPSSNPALKAETNGTATSLIQEPTNEASDPAKVFAGVLKSRRTVRESYTTNKITLGEDYIGNAMRLTPATFSITPAIQFNEFPARNAKRQSVHEFGTKAVWRLEKQAVKFCQEAEALITQVTEKNAYIQAKLKQHTETVLLAGNQRHTFLKEYAQSSRKPSVIPGIPSLGKPVNQDVFGTKPVTRFPYINHKKQQSIVGLSPRSSPSELSLPQLLLHDGNGARSPPATTYGRGGFTDNKLEQVRPEEGANGKLFLHYSYGAAKKLGLR